MTTVMEFALALTRYRLESYSNGTTLASSIEKAHKLLFSLAVQSLFSTTGVDGRLRMGSASVERQAIAVVRPLALAVEASLGLASILTLVLLCAYRRRSSQMTHDPGSIRDILKMISPPSGGKNHAMLSLGQKQASKDRSAILQNGRISVYARQSQDNGALECSVGACCSSQPSTLITSSQVENSTSTYPWVLRLPVGYAFVALLVALLSTIILLNQLAKEYKGLKSFTENAVLRQLLISYVPVIFATFLEPFWTLLNRVLCILQPFQTLRRANSPMSKSLELRYSCVPPQLALWRAVRARNGLLVLVCAIGLSTNILAVALAGLFVNTRTEVSSEETLQSLYIPKFDQVFNLSGSAYWPDTGIFLATSASILKSSPPLPWVLDNTFFVPFAPHKSTELKVNATFSGATQGFGVNMSCQPTKFDTNAYIKVASEMTEAPQVNLIGGKACNSTITSLLGGQSGSITSV